MIAYFTTVAQFQSKTKKILARLVEGTDASGTYILTYTDLSGRRIFHRLISDGEKTFSLRVSVPDDSSKDEIATDIIGGFKLIKK